MKYFSFTIFYLSLFAISAEEQDTSEKKHNHKNEISIASGVVPLPAEDTVTAGFHFHYIRGVADDNKFGIGLGLETILDEHKHYTTSIVFQYRIFKGLILGYSPGLLIRQQNSETVYQFAQHIETAYEFELGQFHIGPMAEIGIEPTGVHYMGGLHFGINF